MHRALFLFLALAFPALAMAASSGTLTHRQSGPSSDVSRPRSGSSPDARLAEPPSRPVDNVQIVSITPTKLTAGVTQTVTVRVKYTLVTKPKGLICVGFNTGTATSFRLVKERWIGAGTGEIDLAVEIVPARWPEHPFKAYVNLSAEPHPKQRTSLAADVLALKLN
jgi:hypothetical protein